MRQRTRTRWHGFVSRLAIMGGVALICGAAIGWAQDSVPPPDSNGALAANDASSVPATADATSDATADATGDAGAASVEASTQRIGTRSVLQIMRDGGPLMYPIAGCSFLTLVFLMERFIALRRARVIPGPFSRKFLEQLREGVLDRDEALELCEENPSPVARVFAAAVKKWGKPAVEVEQALLDSGERVTNDLRRNVRLFNAISTVSPLLGLLGTVFGMISCFNSIASSDAMGRPELLAAGIGEALLTTAAGLAVAIPALIAYWYFVSRVDRLVMDIDAVGQEVVDIISAEAKADASRNKSPKREKAA